MHVRFGSRREAEIEVELAKGRSWRGRKVNAQISNPVNKDVVSQQLAYMVNPPMVPGEAAFSNPWFKPRNQVLDSHLNGTHKQDGSFKRV